MRPLPAFLLALLAALAPPAPARGAEREGPRIAVERGRAVLVTRGERGQGLAPGATASAAAVGFLAVPAGSLAHLAWEGRGSLRVEGPSELEWSGAGDALAWRLLAPGKVELEVRRGPVRLALPDGWSARLEAGAYRVEALSGATRVGARAGAPLALVPLVPEGRARPPVVLAPGAEARLGPHLVPLAKGDALAAAEPWTSARWPWRGRGGAPAWSLLEPSAPTAHERPPAAEAGATSGPPDGEREPARAAQDPPPERAPDPDASAAPVAPARPGDPVAVPALEPPRPGPRPSGAPAPLPFRSEHWRGFPRAALERFAFGFLERVEGLRWTPLGGGLWQLALAEDAPLPAWLMCERRDVSLGPGSSITLDEGGSLRGYQGSVRIVPPPPERPALSELAP